MRGRRARRGYGIGVTEGTQGKMHTRGKCEEGGLYKMQMHKYTPIVRMDCVYNPTSINFAHNSIIYY